MDKTDEAMQEKSVSQKEDLRYFIAINANDLLHHWYDKSVD